MIINRVDADDERQLFQLARYGYLFTRLVRGLGRDKDLMVCTLTREAWEANKFNARLKHHEGVEIPIEEAA
jgi:hypothetical protein